MNDPVLCCESMGLQTPLSALQFRNPLPCETVIPMEASLEYLEVNILVFFFYNIKVMCRTKLLKCNLRTIRYHIRLRASQKFVNKLKVLKIIVVISVLGTLNKILLGFIFHVIIRSVVDVGQVTLH